MAVLVRDAAEVVVTPLDLAKAGHKLFGHRHWKAKLAGALGVNTSTIHRLGHREDIPGPYVIAIRFLLENKKRQDEIDRAARMMLPARLRRKSTDPRAKKKKRVMKSVVIPPLLVEPEEC